MTLTDPAVQPLGPVARRFGVPIWQLRRVFERGLLPEPSRVGAYRVIAREDLPLVEEALRKAGYLPRHEESES
jgi:DNA-binding transcriptional MerR regulator